MTATSSSQAAGGSGDVFATTHWTVVLAAGRPGAPEADVALDALCRAYWYPLYAYVRHRGFSREDAEDLVQGFFARFLKRNYLASLSSERGRFRSFMLAALKHFLANEWDRTQRQKRGGGVAPIALDWQGADSRYRIEPADPLSPDKLYDRAWATALLELVIGRLRGESVASGRADFFDAVKEFLAVGKAAIPYADAATRTGLSEGTVRVAVHRLRKRYRELLRIEIAQTLADPAQVEDELRSLFAAVAT